MDPINWKYIYRNRSEGLPPEPLSIWSSDVDENVHLTLEWLCRYNRTGVYVKNDPDGSINARGNYMTCQENVTERIADSQWYSQLWAPGMFYHICDPVQLLQFRRQYEGVKMNTYRIRAAQEFRMNWRHQLDTCWGGCWSVVGRDGWTASMLHRSSNEPANSVEPYTGIDKFLSNGIGYRYYCHKCTSHMPKGVKAWVKINALKKSLQGSTR